MLSSENPPATVPADLREAIRASRRVALIGHVNPDADCLGSMAALRLGLPELRIEPRVSLPAGTVARRLTTLLQLGALSPAAGHELAACDVAIVLDTARPRRVNLDGKLDALGGVPVVNIDHHASNPAFGRWNWIEPARSSTSEMVCELLAALDIRLTPPMATLLYSGLHSDTQGFSLGRTTPRALALAARLAAAGAEIASICHHLNHSHTPAEFRLLRLVYENTRASEDGRLAWSSVSLAELESIGCAPRDIDCHVEIVRSLAEVRIALLFTEADPGLVRVNLRGQSDTPVLALAERIGGGGHEASAGAVFHGTLEQAMKVVIAEAGRELARATAGG